MCTFMLNTLVHNGRSAYIYIDDTYNIYLYIMYTYISVQGPRFVDACIQR